MLFLLSDGSVSSIGQQNKSMKPIHQDKLDQGRNFYCAHFLSLVAFSFVLGFFFEIEIFSPHFGHMHGDFHCDFIL